MMNKKFKKIKNSQLRALNSEMIPYEVPLPFTTALLFEFLQKLGFEWTTESGTAKRNGTLTFRVRRMQLGESERKWLEVIFDGFNFKESPVAQQSPKKTSISDAWIEFSLKKKPTHPLKYRVVRSNGLSRNLDIIHPFSMLEMAFFLHQFADTILYFTTRSRFSLRYPYRVARFRIDPDFRQEKDSDSGFRFRRDLRADHYSNFFIYKDYLNINEFYESDQFRACERKYISLIKADVSKCFDSIYTHSMSWATNGLHASKGGRVKGTFGDKFDSMLQYLNYAETNGIVIGPEFSRIFAEIILQEIDIRVDRELLEKGLIFGVDYEIKRYIDDYFIFVSDGKQSVVIEKILSKHLTAFKLHLNDLKRQEFDTPLKSALSVAKSLVNETLEKRSVYRIDPKSSMPLPYFSAKQAGIDIQSILLQMELEYSDIANFCLKKIKKMVKKVVRKIQEDLEALDKEKILVTQENLHSTRTKLASYLIANIEFGISIYAGAPCVSHSVKLTELIVDCLDLINKCGFRHLDRVHFIKKITQELRDQLKTVKEEAEFSMHTLRLIDCLIFLEPDIEAEDLLQILSRRGLSVSDLDAFGVLTFLRRFQGTTNENIASKTLAELKESLLKKAKDILDKAGDDTVIHAGRAILRLSLPILEGLSLEEAADATGFSCQEIKVLRKCKNPPSMFAWDAGEDYSLRLRLQSKRMVY